MYRSRDKDFMENLKKNVLRVTKELKKEDRHYALHYLRTHVKLDDLHRLALKKFPGKVIIFGEGGLCPKVVIATKDPISLEAKEKLFKALKKMDLEENDVYFACLRFVKTKKKQDDRHDLFEKLLNILQPSLLIVFDDLTLDTIKSDIQIYATGLNASILTHPEATEHRKQLGKGIRESLKNLVS